MNDSIKLTSEKTWDAIWGTHLLPLTIKGKNSPYYVDRVDAFFHNYLPKKKDYEFLELGCAPGRWLHYFAVEFGYKVSGIDNSRRGVEITRKNLELLNIDATLFIGDALIYLFPKTFDVVFSLGLIEHFDPPSEIINKHLDLVNKSGYAIIGIPNLKHSLYFYLQRLMNKKVLEHHLLLTKNEVDAFIRDHIVIASEYVGVFNLYLLNLGHKSFWYKMISFTQMVIDKLIRVMKIKTETHFFSPYIFVVIKKNDNANAEE